jgi:AcrR family transcriptional regulator
VTDATPAGTRATPAAGTEATTPAGPDAASAQWLERPARADARRNYDLLIGAARESFAEHGVKTSLEEVARRAGVGIGTLYRRFPNRQALLEAVYIDEIRSVCDQAADMAKHLPPWEALATWLRSFVDYGISKQWLAHELVDVIGKESDFFQVCKAQVRNSAAVVLTRAQEAGEARSDVDVLDVLRLIGGIVHVNTGETDRAQSYRLLDLVLDGLRTQRDRDDEVTEP